MGTPSVSPPRREAGQHAQEMAERAARGAEGERKVGAILEDLGPDWHGRIPVEHIDERMLSQAYAESPKLDRDEVVEIAERLRLALEVDAAPTRNQGG